LPQSLNIIGAGRVGRTLAGLWQRAGVFVIGDVLSRTVDRALGAVAFIGAGRATMRLENMRAADVWMVTTPDDAIASAAAALAAARLVRSGDVVFHCSGALSSAELAPAAQHGARIASVHPVKSFVDPQRELARFPGTWCAAEGDPEALARLESAFERIGARVAKIEAASKLLYHAGNVLASNDLIALVAAALRCYAEAGIAPEAAIAMIEPLLRESLANALALGGAQALTGPVARGDAGLVARQLDALYKADPQIAAVYRALGDIAVRLAREKGEASTAALDAIARLFSGSRGAGVESPHSNRRGSS
jgi:predicted short-subunit dehydrogenase-like oxidoreductase (DUF2520 family)